MVHRHPDGPEVDGHPEPDLTLETADLDTVGRFSGGVPIRTIRTVSTYSHLRCRPEDIASEWYEQAWIGFDSHVHGEGTDEDPLLVEAPDLDDFVHFGFCNGTFNAWPYWREHVRQVTTRMGITPLVVPVFRVRKTS